DDNECTQVHAAKLGQNSLGLSEEHSTIKLYPNPSTEYLYIGGSVESTSIRITNMNGQYLNLPKNQDADGLKIDVRTLESGMYFVTYVTPESNWRSSFVKQ